MINLRLWVKTKARSREGRSPALGILPRMPLASGAASASVDVGPKPFLYRLGEASLCFLKEGNLNTLHSKLHCDPQFHCDLSDNSHVALCVLSVCR